MFNVGTDSISDAEPVLSRESSSGRIRSPGDYYIIKLTSEMR